MMDALSPKERLQRTLNNQGADRPPVICPGGMMNAAIVEIMQKSGNVLPAAHHEGNLMEKLAASVQKDTGFENFGIPFCMTVEAEALGSDIDFGSLECEPKIAKEVFPSVKDVNYLPKGSILKNKRTGAVIDAIYGLSQKYPDVPAIGTITGPLSLAASIVDPMTFLKELRRDRENAHKVLEYVAEELIAYAKLMADNGAAAITIADPTATGEILGPKFFEEYAVSYINKITDAIHALGLPVIVHICGEVRMVTEQMGHLHGKAVSVDAMVNLKNLKNETGIKTTMGNLSTYLLEFSNPEKVYENAQRLLGNNIDILAPACGLSTSTPLANIQAFTTAVKHAPD
ncbi:MAG: methylcobamide--CoM methyltransferase [Treponema sp.]|jgi:[methyl-Co(III) methanol-specific corrinoid protein]:coenzyme M methyltransferase|nr:methylcobamide--CoM methyltransferase [Treponema sp.]